MKMQLQEYQQTFFDRDLLSRDEALSLHDLYGSKVEITFPSPLTDNMWGITSKGYVGIIPVSDNKTLEIQTKVDIANLFGMLEYAYNLKDLRFYDGMASCKSLEDVYEKLAVILAKRVLDRVKRGLYRDYISEYETLPYVRGRLMLNRKLRDQVNVNLPCAFEENTANILENRILLWTLWTILRSGICSSRSEAVKYVRKAYRTICGDIACLQVKKEDILQVLYNRLNDDYRPLHALCRFFLENTGPTCEVGNKNIPPFLINMENLFEVFVAAWLKKNLPSEFFLESQESVSFKENNWLRFQIDMVLYEKKTGTPLMVMDTKYKAPDKPSTDDVQQVIAYAVAKDCPKACLIYPQAFDRDFECQIQELDFRTFQFNLDGDLDHSGEIFLDQLYDFLNWQDTFPENL